MEAEKEKISGKQKKKLLWKQQKKNMQTGKIKNRKKGFYSPTQNLEGGAVADELRQTGIEGEWGVVSPLVSPDHY